MTARRGGILAVSLGSALAACAQPPPAGAPAQPSAAAVVPAREDAPSRFVGLIGTRAQHAPPFLGVPETNFYCLRSFLDRQTGETRHQLYVSASYSGPERRWAAAPDRGGRALAPPRVPRNRTTCDARCSPVKAFAPRTP